MKRLGPWLPIILVCVIVTLALALRGEDKPFPKYEKPRRLATLKNESISESSGMGASHRHPGVFWTHNDSGDKPRLFAFDREGNDRGELRIENAKADDWEDISTFVWNDKPFLLIGDVGDNQHLRKECQLYLVAEPELSQRSAKVFREIRFRFPDGPHDCEAVSVDATEECAILVTKTFGRCQVFRVDLAASTEVKVAQEIARLNVSFITAMDISPDGQWAVVSTYYNAYQFRRDAGESWTVALGKSPQVIELPARVQGESICYGADGKSLYLTSEGIPTPLWEVRSK